MRRALKFRDCDWTLLAMALAIAIVGIVEIYSTTAHTSFAPEYRKQITWVLLGCLLALVVSRIDYRRILEQFPWLYALSLLALGGLLLFGTSVAGARRWARLGPFTFQVSEIAKLVIIVGVAAHFADRRGGTVTWKELVKLGILVGLPALLVALEPDLGTALTFVPVLLAGIFMAGIEGRKIAFLLLLGLATLPAGWHFLKPYQRERLMTFVHPSHDIQGSSYQGLQSRIAIGSGGFWGKGLGNGTQSRLGFIPVSRADFIFAAWAEERGFVGTLFVLLLYFALLLRLLDGAQNSGDRAGAFLLVGFTAVLFFQVVVNIGMMIGFFPITGIPLPLVSHGGSAILSTFLGLGLAMSVHMRRFVN